MTLILQKATTSDHFQKSITLWIASIIWAYVAIDIQAIIEVPHVVIVYILKVEQQS